MERVIERRGGLDVHKKTVAACIRTPGPNGARTQPVQTSGTTVGELLTLRDWLEAHRPYHSPKHATRLKHVPCTIPTTPAGRKAWWCSARGLAILPALHSRKDTIMPTFHHYGASIYYEEFGQGFPILTFAPAGLQSIIDVWHGPSAPIDPTTEFAEDFRVIAMDQRNAGGRSRAPITAEDGWPTYAADHVALLDHLRIERCHLYGQCIGGSFIMSLLKREPQRFASAVLAQPIGRVGEMKPGRPARFEMWAKTLGDHPEATESVLDAFYQNLYGPGFVYSVDRAFVSSCRTPCLVLAGNDEAHPLPISEEVAKLLPDAEFILDWKTGAALAAAKARVKAFLARHTPRR
jgi:pimeloyl-ACP methyl ester carboxylesterase